MSAYVGPCCGATSTASSSRSGRARSAASCSCMQSNGGVATPELVHAQSGDHRPLGPAGGPIAGLAFARGSARTDCVVVDMGGTSFDASIVKNGEVQVTRQGEINRHAVALPMIDVHTIGAGGGSIGWLDDGGLLRMGPAERGRRAGPAPPTAGAATCRPARTPTSSSDTSIRTTSSAAGCGSGRSCAHEAVERADRRPARARRGRRRGGDGRGDRPRRWPPARRSLLPARLRPARAAARRRRRRRARARRRDRRGARGLDRDRAAPLVRPLRARDAARRPAPRPRRSYSCLWDDLDPHEARGVAGRAGRRGARHRSSRRACRPAAGARRRRPTCATSGSITR